MSDNVELDHISEENETGNELAHWLQNAIDLFDSSNFGHGDEITHNWLKHALQIPKPQTLEDAERISLLRLQRVEAFKDYLLSQRQMALKSTQGVGYHIIPPNQQARYAAEILVKSIRSATNKSSRLLEHTDFDKLNEEDRRKHVDTEIRIRSVSEIFTRERRKILIDII